MKKMRIVAAILTTLILLSSCGNTRKVVGSDEINNMPAPQTNTNNSGGTNSGSKEGNTKENKPETPANSQNIIVVSNSSDINVVINKKRSLPDNWKPNDLVAVNVPYKGRTEAKYMRKEAAEALDKLFDKAKDEGIEIWAVSGFRSYELQKTVFAKNVSKLGEAEARKISAYPGQSEHQTGLAMDISSAAMNYSLEQSFGNTKEGKWLKKNAAEFGFIVRYLEGKETIIGYIYEPWHIRYVGESTALEIMSRNITLEEYFGL